MDLSEVYKVTEEAENGKPFDLYGDGCSLIIRSTDSEAYQKSLNRRANRLSRVKNMNARIQIMNECMAESLWIGMAEDGKPLTDEGVDVDGNDEKVRLKMLSKYRPFRNDIMRVADDLSSFYEEQDQD